MKSTILQNLLKNRSVIAKTYNNKTESLGRHVGSLLRVSAIIFKLFNDKHSINKELLHQSILWHDVGKCEKSWLDNKTVRDKSASSQLCTRHELLSFLVAYNHFKNKSLGNFEKSLILMPILLHHNKYISIKNDFSNPDILRSTFLQDNTRKIEWMYGLEKFTEFKLPIKQNKNGDLTGMIRKIIKNISQGLTIKESYDIQYHCMLLCAIDQMASAEYTNEEIESFFNVTYVAPKKNFILRKSQQYVIDAFNKNTGLFILDLRPGSGKTTITESICEKMNRCPVHGTPKNVIADDLATKYNDSRIFDMSDPGDPDDTRNIDSIRRKASWFTKKKPALYTTPDNIFLMSQGYKRHFMFLRCLFNGIVIIDEYHDCYVDALRGFNLSEMVQKFNHFNIPVILMSGTTPTTFVKIIHKELIGTTKDIHFISDRNCTLTHYINNVSMPINVAITNNNRGKIKFFEGNPCDMIVNGFQWWDCKNFHAGYFFEVMKLIDNYVDKNESAAICFSSKKSIFHFLHLLDKFTGYRLCEDYAVVCSPTMVYDHYKNTIIDAINELKKDNIGKPRKFKFILCTSYTEMGVDFSVQHMIIENCFLHNLDQQLGRLNRWGEFGTNADCTIFPAFTRYGKEEENYRRSRYGNDQNYNNLLEFYRNKKEVSFDMNWYTQEEMDLHYAWSVSTTLVVNWEYSNTCGVYRTSSEHDMMGVNGMYREVDTISIISNNQEFNVPLYRIDSNTKELNKIPHRCIFV